MDINTESVNSIRMYESLTKANYDEFSKNTQSVCEAGSFKLFSMSAE